MNEQKSVTPEELQKIQEKAQPQQQGAQIGLGGGLIPQPGGGFTYQIWFSNLPTEQIARQFAAQVEKKVQELFTQQQPPQQTNGPAPPNA